MTKLISISISIIFLLQSVHIHFEDILQLKELMEHANMHKERYGDSFTVFLSKHYGELKESHKKQHQEEEKEHHTPIHHDCASQIQVDLLIEIITFSINTPKITNRKTSKFYYQDQFSIFEKQPIFQPPRAVHSYLAS